MKPCRRFQWVKFKQNLYSALFLVMPARYIHLIRSSLIVWIYIRRKRRETVFFSDEWNVRAVLCVKFLYIRSIFTSNGSRRRRKMRKSGDTVVLVGDPLERETTKINNIFTKKKKKTFQHISYIQYFQLFLFFFIWEFLCAFEIQELVARINNRTL